MESLLDKIDQPSDLKKLNAQQVEKLCAEIRHFMLENISKTGGHLASNLGTVELTVALHRVLETPKDKIVFDVGHQCYTHKLLTGRRKQFDHLRQLDAPFSSCGMGEKPRNRENVCGSWMAFPASQTPTKVCTMPLLPDMAIQHFRWPLAWHGQKRSSMSPDLWWH